MSHALFFDRMEIIKKLFKNLKIIKKNKINQDIKR